MLKMRVLSIQLSLIFYVTHDYLWCKYHNLRQIVKVIAFLGSLKFWQHPQPPLPSLAISSSSYRLEFI